MPISHLDIYQEAKKKSVKSQKKLPKYFVVSEKVRTFAPAFGNGGMKKEFFERFT